MYTAYSVRHALITALFNMGLKEQEVDEYTEHSNNAHTALTNYFYSDENWVGRSLVGAGADTQVSERAARHTERDNQQLQTKLQEGKEETLPGVKDEYRNELGSLQSNQRALAGSFVADEGESAHGAMELFRWDDDGKNTMDGMGTGLAGCGASNTLPPADS
jgi:hypothetical protein